MEWIVKLWSGTRLRSATEQWTTNGTRREAEARRNCWNCEAERNNETMMAAGARAACRHWINLNLKFKLKLMKCWLQRKHTNDNECGECGLGFLRFMHSFHFYKMNESEADGLYVCCQPTHSLIPFTYKIITLLITSNSMHSEMKWGMNFGAESKIIHETKPAKRLQCNE